MNKSWIKLSMCFKYSTVLQPAISTPVLRFVAPYSSRQAIVWGNGLVCEKYQIIITKL